MRSIKKILLVGVFSSNPNVYTYAKSFEKVLLDAGYIVEKFNYREKTSAFLSKIPRISDLRININLKKVAKKFKPDLIFVIKGEIINPKTLQDIKHSTGSLMVNFYTDNPFVFWNGNSNKNVLLSIPYYDIILTWSKILEAPLLSAGAKKIFYFPFCHDEEIFNINFKDKPSYLYDVVFVGTWDRERQELLEKIIDKIKHINLAIWGNEWKHHIKNSSLANFFMGNGIYEGEMIKIFRQSKIVLNFIRIQNFQSHNMRTMEALATKSLLLTKRTTEQSELLFKEDKHLVCFSDIDELVHKINFYLKNESLRNQIAEEGFWAVKNYSLQQKLPKLIESFTIERPIKERNELQSITI